MPSWPATHDTQIAGLQEQLHAEKETNLLLTESMVDMQLALEDRGWLDIASAVHQDFTPEARKALITLCRTMVIANPLLKRGVTVRVGYIWGQGVQVNARAGVGDQAQDVNAIVKEFLDANTATFTDDDAHARLESGLATDGNVFIACFTSPLTGAVQARTALSEEVVDIINNPDDRDDPWFYIRHVPQQIVEPAYSSGSRVRQQVVKVAHPALGYRPAVRPKTLNGMPIRWDAPIKHVKVNPVPGWRFGIPDVYASIAWARAYKDFLVDWAQLSKSLAKFAWQAVGGTKTRAQKAAQEIARGSGSIGPVPPVGAAQSPAGQSVVGTGDIRMEAISKSGATIDSNSGKPLAGMAAAGLGLPVTILLADPGVTGARAVAETLDLPTILEMGMRRLLWQSVYTEVIEYAIDQAVIAPQGALRGTTTRDEWGVLSTVLAGDVEKTLDWDWPPLVDVDPVELVKALVDASDSTVGRAVPLVLLRLMLNALGVKDVDEVLEKITDDDGLWVDPDTSAGQAAVDAFRRGEDPAETVA